MAGEPSDADFFADAVAGVGSKASERDDSIVFQNEGDDGGQQQQPPRIDRGDGRDPQGRFAPQGQEGQQGEGGEEPEQGQIPSWRLRELNAARREAERERDDYRRQLDDYQRRLANIEAQRKPPEPPKPPPDPLSDPQGFYGHLDERFGSVEEAIQEAVDRREVNRTFAAKHREHGQAFEQAYMAVRQEVAQGNSRLFDDIVASYDPGESLMAWWKGERLRRDMGDDPDGYMVRFAQNLLRDETFKKTAMEQWGIGQQQQGGPGNSSSTVIRLPSVNRSGGSAGSRGNGASPDRAQLPATDRDYFNDAAGGLPSARHFAARRG